MKLELENLSWQVQGIPIVNDVTLRVRQGEFVGLLGPNGSGKSSLLRMIYRVHRPTAGRVLLNGADVWRLSTRQVAQRLAVVAQENTGDFEFTVEEVVRMGRTPHKGLFDRDTDGDQRLIHTALQRVSMLAFAHRAFSTLSGGEKQRVLVARALVQEANFLILDEPTNHLDIRYQLEILELVRSLAVTTFAALHDLNLAAMYCNRLYVLQAGCIVAEGTPTEVLTPELIKQVYGVRATVEPHPQLHYPHIRYQNGSC